MAAPEGYNALGKIGISYKGEYASNTAYERLDAVYHNGSTYLAIKDAPDGAPRDDKINWIYLAKGFSGDIGDTAITFTEAETRENIDTGESVKTVFGRVKKWFADMTAAAFAQIITSNTDLMATTVAGYLPDALAVKQQFDSVNSKLNPVIEPLLSSYGTVTGGFVLIGKVCIVTANLRIQTAVPLNDNLSNIFYNIPAAKSLFINIPVICPETGVYYNACIINNTITFLKGEAAPAVGNSLALSAAYIIRD